MRGWGGEREGAEEKSQVGEREGKGRGKVDAKGRNLGIAERKGKRGGCRNLGILEVEGRVRIWNHRKGGKGEGSGTKGRQRNLGIRG